MTSAYTSLAAFVAAASLLTIAPGLDTALVLRTAATRGARPAALAGLGIAAGCFGWAFVVALGLGALLAASQLAYTVLRWIGAASYLVWTGYQLLRNPRRSFLPAGSAPGDHGVAFTTGLLTNLLNPKVGVFYVSFLPQFVPEGVAVAPYILLLGAIHAVLGLAWFASLILATRPLANFLRRPRSSRRVTGSPGGCSSLLVLAWCCSRGARHSLCRCLGSAQVDHGLEITALAMTVLLLARPAIQARRQLLEQLLRPVPLNQLARRQLRHVTTTAAA